MIVSFIVVLASIAAPDLYFLDSKNDLTVASTEAGERGCRICVRKLLPGGAESAHSIKFDTFPSLSCRLSIANQTLWILEVQDDLVRGAYSGTGHLDRDLFVARCLVDEIDGPDERPHRRLPDNLFGTAIGSSKRFEKSIDHVIGQANDQLLSQGNNQMVGESCDIWPFPLYSDLTHRLKYFETPAVVIAAMKPHVAIAGIYLNGKILFVECRARKLSEIEPPRTSDLEKLELIGTGKDGLEWSSLGVADTALNTWATGFWIDDSLHLIGDNGLHERFKIVDRKVIRQGESARLTVASAICQFPSGLWILSRYTADTVASKVPLKADQAEENRKLGDISLDAAAQKILKSD